MLPRLLTLLHDLRSSLWALPLLMVIVAAVAAILAVHIPVREGTDPVWFLYSGSAEEAPQFLSNLVTAMITMATLVVSITMVVLTLAAQQLGPRLIRSFMADRRTQMTLGLFVATVVYLLLVLRSVYGGTESVPNLAAPSSPTTPSIVSAMLSMTTWRDCCRSLISRRGIHPQQRPARTAHLSCFGMAATSKRFTTTASSTSPRRPML
jgi:uncharacterized membrane protein